MRPESLSNKGKERSRVMTLAFKHGYNIARCAHKLTAKSLHYHG